MREASLYGAWARPYAASADLWAVLSMRYWYRAYGLTLHSEIACPELPEAATGAHPDVVIALAPTIDPARQDDEAHVADIADIAIYRAVGGREITISPAPGARPQDIRQYLYGVGLTAILYQRGESPIHAGAIALGGQAHIFCGASGAGKSTLVAHLRRRGVTVLCDDVGVLRQGPDEVISFHHGVPRVKLWQDALTHFGIATSALQRDLTRFDKFHLPLEETAFDSLPLGSIVSLVSRPEDEAPAIVAIPSRQAFDVLVRNSYRPRLLNRLGDPAGHLMRCAAAARQARGFEFHRPWDLGRLDACADALISHLTTTVTGAEA